MRPHGYVLIYPWLSWHLVLEDRSVFGSGAVPHFHHVFRDITAGALTFLPLGFDPVDVLEINFLFRLRCWISKMASSPSAPRNAPFRISMYNFSSSEGVTVAAVADA